ncbi:MAG: DUF1704 domain-containing protein [Polyangiaceae bacterium]
MLGDPRLLTQAERLLRNAEQRIRLLDRALPTNLSRERQRLQLELAAGRALSPRFEYEPVTDLHEVRASLTALRGALAGAGALAQLYAERAEELLLEAELCENVGQPRFRELAERRFPLLEDTGLAALLDAFSSAPDPQPEELVDACDDADPRSLLNVLRRHIGESKVAVRIELREQLHSVAAAGGGFVAVRRGARLTPSAARRIARHELDGHVLPRLRAEAEVLGIYRAGTRGANEDEEGRALCLEQRLSLWDGARQRELAQRHWLGVAARAGAELSELVELGQGRGMQASAALELSVRVLRGGGLGREVVYLPAFLRISRAFADDAACERYFERGRVSLGALPLLRALELNR